MPKTKCSNELKLEVVKYCIVKKHSYLEASKHFNITSTTCIMKRVRKYKKHGKKGLLNSEYKIVLTTKMLKVYNKNITKEMQKKQKRGRKNMQSKKNIKRENSKKEKSKIKAHSGITLIALVITIALNR